MATPRTRSEFPFDALHVFVLAGFAVAQPLFDALARGPEFFFARNARPFDVLATVLLPSLALPAALVLAEAAARALGRRVQKGVHLLVVTGLVGVLVLPVLGRIPLVPGRFLVGAAFVIGLGAAAAYARVRALRTVLTVLSPTVLLFPGLFLFGSAASVILFPPAFKAVRPAGVSTTPVVVLVFDEFPTAALLDARGEIDAASYPNFATLAGHSTWFRNASTVAGMTEGAVAAILTGRYPGPAPLGTAANHSRNLFSLLAGSHELRVVEGYVSYCPRALCARAEQAGGGARTSDLVFDLAVLALHVVLPRDLRAALPDLTYATVLLRPGGGDDGTRRHLLLALAGKHGHTKAEASHRANLVARFLDGIDAGPGPALHYLHVLLPHTPYVYGPTGRICAAPPEEGGMANPGDAALLARTWERFLLQVGYVDTVVGRVVARLTEKGLYDDALLVVTADHGVSNRPGAPRRAFAKSNLCDILSVPLFIKRPHQREGQISHRNVEPIDILPTVAEAVGVRLPWPVDGQSLIDPSRPERPHKVLIRYGWDTASVFGERWRAEFPASAASDCLLGEPAGRCGTNSLFFDDGSCVVRPPAAAPGVVARDPLLGRRVRSLTVAGKPEVTVELGYTGLYEHLELDPALAPCLVEGWLSTDGSPAAGRRLAIAVNGSIRGVTRTVGRGRDRTAAFSAVVSDVSFHPGRNEVEVFLVSQGDGRVQLVPTKRAPERSYELREHDGGLAIASAGGVRIPVRPDAVAGELQRRVLFTARGADTGGSVLARYRGWAADVAARAPAAKVLVFVDGKLYHATHPGIARPDVQVRYDSVALRPVGFDFVVPERASAGGTATAVRVFAVSQGGVASELRLPS
jgi:hypothetical protein